MKTILGSDRVRSSRIPERFQLFSAILRGMCYNGSKQIEWSSEMKAIITVVGKDQKGIVAGVATKVAELGLNIDDISQTVLDEYFTMMAVV